jgi:hypothetical protein
MPLENCTANGVSGKRWGSKGKCYTGKNATKQAIKQGYAEDPKHFNEEMSKSTATLSADEFAKAIMDIEFSPEEISALAKLVRN